MAKQPARQTLLLPMDLGSPARYDQSVFPLSRVQRKDTINQVDLYLEATLDETLKIRQMVEDAENFQQLIRNAKLQYDECVHTYTYSYHLTDYNTCSLLLGKQEMEQQRKSLNPVKRFSAYRSVRLLLEAGKALYVDTKV
jgi:hypothetical protein